AAPRSSARTRASTPSTWPSCASCSTPCAMTPRATRSSSRASSTFTTSPASSKAYDGPADAALAALPLHPARVELGVLAVAPAHLRQADPVLQPRRDGRAAAGVQRHLGQPRAGEALRDDVRRGRCLQLRRRPLAVRAADPRPRLELAAPVWPALYRSRLVDGDSRAARRAYD